MTMMHDDNYIETFGSADFDAFGHFDVKYPLVFTDNFC